MRFAQLREFDISDGNGIRVSLYTQGCDIHCGGCFQKHTWSYKGGKEYTQETEDKIISLCGRSYIKGLSLLGGEPLSIQNYKPLVHLVQRFKEEYPNKDIWIWSGDEIENILQDWRKNIIAYCDVLVCGPFIEEEKDLSLKYCGSRNQRVIDLKTGEVLPNS